MFNFTIMRLDEERMEEYCEDIVSQVKNGVATMPLFMMTLVPEGNPAIDKAGMLCRVYEKYKAKLDRMGVASGVLIQASIGHGWKLNAPFAFQRYTGLTDGRTPEVCCPMDKEFQAYIRQAAKRIAMTSPAHIMLDDDFRLMFRSGKGCVCPLHMKRFFEIAGEEVDRETLYTSLCSEDENSARYRDIFVKTQIDSLIECAHEIRAGIDEIDPSLPGSYCLCGISSEAAYEIASIMAGEGNPVVVRMNNANYVAKDPRNFSHIMYRAKTQLSAMSGCADIVLAETDTCPQNRYSTSAAMMHSHFTFSILEGAKGAKHWITRLHAFEPASGKAYRKKLGKYQGFYQTLSELNDKLEWQGCKIPVPKRPYYLLTPEDDSVDVNGWHSGILDRFGLPLYYSTEKGGVSFFGGNYDKKFTDEELLAFLGGKVVLDAYSAKRFIRRGFGKYIGVSVSERKAGSTVISGEVLNDGRKMSSQFGMLEITAASPEVKTLASAYHLRDGVYMDALFPSVTLYENELGGTVVVFAGNSSFQLGLSIAFGWLNETRKSLLAEILTSMGELPVYYPEDAEVLLKVANIENGGTLVALLNMGLDTMEELPLVIRKDITVVRRLTCDGSFAPVSLTREGENYTLLTDVGVFDPVILILE